MKQRRTAWQTRISGLTQPFDGSLTVGGSIAIRKMVAELWRPPAVYIRALSRNGVEPVRCAGRHARKMKLPAGVPTTLDEAMTFDASDHDPENRSAAGKTVGEMRGVRFATGSARERIRTYLSDFYRAVYRGVQEVERQSAPASFEGWVHQLYLNAGASSQEVYERRTHWSWGGGPVEPRRRANDGAPRWPGRSR
jgi:hypothetical protein